MRRVEVCGGDRGGVFGHLMIYYKKIIGDDDLSLEIKDRNPYLDIVVNIERYRNVRLLLQYYNFSAPCVHIDDIIGNGHYSGYHCKGIGTLLVNTGIQYLFRIMPSNAEVTGRMSYVDDPQDTKKLEYCCQIRANFWKSFGFQIHPGELGREGIYAILANLKPKRYGLVLGKYPRFTPLIDLIQ